MSQKPPSGRVVPRHLQNALQACRPAMPRPLAGHVQAALAGAAQAKPALPGRPQVPLAVPAPQRAVLPKILPCPAPASLARRSGPGPAAVQARFWELSDGAYIWHAESVTNSYVSLNKSYKKDGDWFSWAVYRKLNPRDEADALTILKTTYPSYASKMKSPTIHRLGHDAYINKKHEFGHTKYDEETSQSGFTVSDTREVYIHSGREADDTVIHEMVHASCGGPMFKYELGTSWTEGFTQYLANKALLRFGFATTSSYSTEAGMVTDGVGSFWSEADLERAYFEDKPDLLAKQASLDDLRGYTKYDNSKLLPPLIVHKK